MMMVLMMMMMDSSVPPLIGFLELFRDFDQPAGVHFMVHANYPADGSPAHYFEVQTLVLLDDDWIFAPQYRLKDSSLKDSRDSARNLN